MTITITIKCDNAAFGETEYDCGQELQRILHVLGDDLAENGPSDNPAKTLYDINGNRVGNCIVSTK